MSSSNEALIIVILSPRGKGLGIPIPRPVREGMTGKGNGLCRR